MSIHRRVALHEEADSSGVSSGLNEEWQSRDGTPKRLQRENETLKLQLREQQEKLRLLEEQIRLANIQSENESKSIA